MGMNKVTITGFPLGIDNCFLLQGERTIFIDGGAPGSFPSFVSGLRRLNMDPKQISLILLTHGHWDHIGALAEIQKLTGAPVAVHQRDQAWVESGKPDFPAGVTVNGRIINRVMTTLMPGLGVTPVKIDSVLGDDGLDLHEYGIPGKAIYTPGHSMGSISIVLESGEAFVGDMAMNEWYLRMTPGLPVLADDINMVVESWKKLLPEKIHTVYPAHGKPFSMNVMRRELDGYHQ
jgi:glyoxylase-like metal-dependent hydrolase (beta-lactamase superfamily II)